MGASCTRERITVEDRRFYIIKRLGEGGFSYVDQVEEGSTGKKFALKRIQCHSVAEERAAEEEARFHHQFTSPNLISLEAWCKGKSSREDSEVLLVLPYLKRGTLQDELDRLAARGDHLPEGRLWKLVRGICEGVQALHHAQPPVVHRDLKPGNVMLAEDDTAVIMDFGSMTQGPTEIKGRSEAVALQDVAAEKCSMLFRAPELFHVDSHCIVDEKVDIWLLIGACEGTGYNPASSWLPEGCVIFNMAFLQSPFEPVYQRGDSLHLAVLGRNYKFPENSRYPPGLKELVDSMLTVEAVERPNIDWVIDKLSSIERDRQNTV